MTVKERPILFKPAMIHAIQARRKFQTRRLLDPQPQRRDDGRWVKIRGTGESSLELEIVNKREGTREVRFGTLEESIQSLWKCPYGKPGDRLWVRETWGIFDTLNVTTRQKLPLFEYVKYDESHSEYIDPRYDVMYAADCPENSIHWRPSIHMPRWVSRFLLDVTAVRAERLQDITAEDAIAEGLHKVTKDGKLFKYGIPDRDGLPGNYDVGWPWTKWEVDPRAAYRTLWEDINGKGSWERNPMVWVVGFNQNEGGI